MLKATKADRFVLAISDSQNWRKDLLPSYKEGRSKLIKPLLLKAMKEWIQKEYPKETQIIPRLEGDDVIGIRATCGKKHTYIMVSIDKDMKTVPGNHYNFDKGTSFKVTPEEAEMYHMTQTLTGDVTDGYKGLPGCGPAKAKKILERKSDKTLWEKVVEAYEKSELTEADALVQARMAFILQSNFFNQETKEPILWTPPQPCKGPTNAQQT